MGLHGLLQGELYLYIFTKHPVKGSSVGIRGNRVLESLTSVNVFVYVMSAAIAVTRLPRVIVYMICAATLNKS
jgi:hypothetical protein